MITYICDSCSSPIDMQSPHYREKIVTLKGLGISNDSEKSIEMCFCNQNCFWEWAKKTGRVRQIF